MLTEVRIKKLYSNAKLPARAYSGDVGYDLFCMYDFIIPALKLTPYYGTAVALQADPAGFIEIYGNEFKIVPGRVSVSLGICADFDPHYEAAIKDKSGLALNNGLHVFAGVIEGGFRGEWKVILINFSDKDYLGKSGQKVAQVIFRRKEDPEMIEVSELSDSQRGEAGWGSSGKV